MSTAAITAAVPLITVQALNGAPQATRPFNAAKTEERLQYKPKILFKLHRLHPRISRNRSAKLVAKTYPEGDDDEEHFEEHAEDNVVGESHGHDPQKRCACSHHHRGPDFPKRSAYPQVLRDASVLFRLCCFSRLE